jgi:hypothetical protein
MNMKKLLKAGLGLLAISIVPVSARAVDCESWQVGTDSCYTEYTKCCCTGILECFFNRQICSMFQNRVCPGGDNQSSS